MTLNKITFSFIKKFAIKMLIIKVMMYFMREIALSILSAIRIPWVSPILSLIVYHKLPRLPLFCSIIVN